MAARPQPRPYSPEFAFRWNRWATLVVGAALAGWLLAFVITWR